MKLKKAYPFLLISVIVTLGLAAVFTATYSFEDNKSLFLNQLFSAVLGFVSMLMVAKIHPLTFKKISPLALFVSVVLLLFVLVSGTGLTETGSKSWISLGPISFQPSEIAKAGFILSFSWHISLIHKKMTFIHLLGLLLHISLYVIPICLQPDFGTAAVFIFIGMVMIFFSGAAKKFFVITGSMVLISLPLLWFSLKEYQKNRILVFLNPSLDPKGVGYNVLQSKTALGGGKIFGQGFLNGMLTQSELLPAKHTDFIFSVIGEEAGLIGCGCFLILLFLICIYCFHTSYITENPFETAVSSGIGAMFLFHTVINTGMCVGFMPVTGIPLPFVSYGGTFLIISFILYGAVISQGTHSVKNYRCKANKRQNMNTR